MPNQPNLFAEANSKTNCWIMLSLQPQYYQELCQGLKKTEYRKGIFLREPVQGFVYCTSPVMEVGAYIKLGQPTIGTPEEIAQLKEKEAPGSYKMMMEWMEGVSEASAVPVEEVKTFAPIKLKELQEKFNFHPPQRFIYLDKNQELLTFLKQSSGLF